MNACLLNATGPDSTRRAGSAVLTMTVVPVEPVRSSRCAASCSACTLHSVCLPGTLAGQPLADMDELTRVKRRIAKGATLYRRGDSFESLYAVRSGSFKTVALCRQGEEKVTGLHLPGEVIGLDAISTKKHGYDAMALEDSVVCTIPFAALAAEAQRVPELQAQLLRIVSGDIARDHGLMLVLGALDAEQRVVAFLLSLSQRYERLGYAATRFSLRMSREEIGSYLGLTLETVSRVFSRLQRDGVLTAHQKEVELRNLRKLREKALEW